MTEHVSHVHLPYARIRSREPFLSDSPQWRQNPRCCGAFMEYRPARRDNPAHWQCLDGCTASYLTDGPQPPTPR
jgi:hypothetical protein